MRLTEHDLRLAQAINRASASTSFLLTCRVASWLGDGVLWYMLILLLPVVAGPAGWQCAEHMLLAGVISLVIYKLLKHTFGRPRPYQACAEIRLCGRVIDQFSFPSGHTFHAVGFACCVAYHFPRGAAFLAPVVVLIALSRVVLGLHYPSDVLAGAGFGAAVGLLSIWLI